MNGFDRILTRLTDRLSTAGYACDVCGAEVFEYPVRRLCEKCEAAQTRNDGNRCDKCGRQTVTPGVCLSCKKSAPKFTKGFSPFVYFGDSASCINRIKRGNRRLAHFFGEAMATYFIENCKSEPPYFSDGEYRYGGQPLLILPVPLSANALSARGYNQAYELARCVLHILQDNGFAAEIDTETLEKNKETEEQKHLGFFERAENASGVYHVHNRALCKDRTILLVDDIMTTGATGNECAKRLLGAGAHAVFFLTACSLQELK